MGIDPRNEKALIEEAMDWASSGYDQDRFGLLSNIEFTGGEVRDWEEEDGEPVGSEDDE